ncbi:MAG: quercetin 2,3-dioxygenase [Nocardioidaceae bacterium]|jgi:redox-sensitive bicupin YhaK (pirin superfamily)|nr:quercetin 2,3-dioxygenase [Nocardioidaceae bacterium]
MTGQPAQIEVRRSADRFVTQAEGRTTRHSFSFDRHYDPQNVALGFLLCHNDDLVSPGHGYPLHPHRELEIVTWVLGGRLRHEDSAGHGGTVSPGAVQRLSAGRGVLHTEVTDGADPVHFVQMWVRPDVSGEAPDYAQDDVSSALGEDGWVVLASGLPRHSETAAVPLRNRYAGLHAARLGAGKALTVPEAPLLHLFVAEGAVDLEGVGRLGTGDAVRLQASGGQRLTTPDSAELLLWEMRPA